MASPSDFLSMLPPSIYKWLSWDLSHLRNAFVVVYTVRGVWKMCLLMKNMRVLRDASDPPSIFEIPSGETSMKSWNEQRQTILGECQFLLLETLFDVHLTLAKIISHYYPYLWAQTAKYGSSSISRAIWFTVFDFIVNEIGRLVASGIVDIFHEGYNLHTHLFSVLPLLLSKIITTYIAVIFFNLFGLKVIVVELVMYRIIRVTLLNPLIILPRDNLITAVEQDLPGAAETIELASRMGFPTNRLLLDQGGSRPPQATYYNFFFIDRLVITKNLFIVMDPGQATSIVAHELCHWKYGHAYVNYACTVIVNMAKFYVYLMAYEDPRFAQFFRLGTAHPIIPLTLAYSLVWPVTYDVVSGLANFVSSYRELRCDDFAGNVTDPTNLRGALVKMAPYRVFHPFDGWFSSWFYGEPSLKTRILRVNRRIQRELTGKTELPSIEEVIHQNPTYRRIECVPEFITWQNPIVVVLRKYDRL